MKIYTDGGTKDNGGENQESYVAVWAKNKIVVYKKIGNKTSNQSEYIALIEGLKWLKNEKPRKRNVFITDSKLMKQQIAFDWQIKTQHLKPLAKTARGLLHETNSILKWRPREENKAGIYLEDSLGI